MSDTWTLMHRRDDGTYVIRLNGAPYHVVASDPLYADVDEAAQGVDLPPEEPISPTPTPAPVPATTDAAPVTRGEYTALIERIASLERQA